MSSTLPDIISDLKISFDSLYAGSYLSAAYGSPSLTIHVDSHSFLIAFVDLRHTRRMFTSDDQNKIPGGYSF